MIRDLLGWAVKTFLHMLFWLFVFSINLGDRTVYDRAYSTFIENSFVSSLEGEASALWNKVIFVAHKTYDDITREQKERLR